MGQHVTRYFKEGRKMVPYRALVKEYFKPEGKGDLPLWHIQHEDGDEEDLEEEEVREGLANDLKAEKERKRQAAAAARAEEESDDEDDDERNGTLWPGKLERKRWRDSVGAPQPSAPTPAAASEGQVVARHDQPHHHHLGCVRCQIGAAKY